jgi:hypothetical protein
MPFWRRKKHHAGPDPRRPVFKVCVLGDAAAGKTDLLRPLVRSDVHDRYITTIGTKVFKRDIAYERLYEGQPVSVRATFLLWDILGQKQYSRLHPVYLQGAKGALIVARDGSTDPSASMHEWARALRDVVGPVPIAFLLNRSGGAALTPPQWTAELLDHFPGATFACVTAADPTLTAEALRALGSTLVDHYFARHPLTHDDLPKRPEKA